MIEKRYAKMLHDTLGLPEKRMRVIALLRRGSSTSQAAEELDISPGTVSNHKGKFEQMITESEHLRNMFGRNWTEESKLWLPHTSLSYSIPNTEKERTIWTYEDMLGNAVSPEYLYLRQTTEPGEFANSERCTRIRTVYSSPEDFREDVYQSNYTYFVDFLAGLIATVETGIDPKNSPSEVLKWEVEEEEFNNAVDQFDDLNGILTELLDGIETV